MAPVPEIVPLAADQAYVKASPSASEAEQVMAETAPVERVVGFGTMEDITGELFSFVTTIFVLVCFEPPCPSVHLSASSSCRPDLPTPCAHPPERPVSPASPAQARRALTVHPSMEPVNRSILGRDAARRHLARVALWPDGVTGRSNPDASSLLTRPARSAPAGLDCCGVGSERGPGARAIRAL